MTALAPNLLRDLNSLLNTTAPDTSSAIKADNATALVNNLSSATTLEEINNAWKDIAIVLFKTYRVSHDNLSRYRILNGGLINALINVTNSCIQDIIYSDMIFNTPSLKEDLSTFARISELPFMIAEYYSVNDQVAEYIAWMNQTKEFVKATHLEQHLVNATRLETEASEISRRLTQKNPHGTIEDCITLFQKALEIYKVNGITIDGPDASARHTQNSLCVAISKQILAMLEKADEITPNVMQQINYKSAEAFRLLEEIEIPFLKSGIDIKALHADFYATLDIATQVADPKRMSNMLSTRALIEFCNNKINDDTKSILVKSLASMPKEAVPQYSNTLNRNANFNLAYATLIYSYINHINTQTAANGILAPVTAFDRLQEIESHDYVKLAKKFFAYNLAQDPAFNAKALCAVQHIDKADELMAQAVQFYVDSFTSTRGNAGESYGNAAKRFLLKIAKHPACMDNSAAMKIVTDAQQMQNASEETAFDRIRAYLPKFSMRNAIAATAGIVAIAASSYLKKGRDCTHRLGS